MSLPSLIYKCLLFMVTSILLAKLPSLGLYCPVMWRNLSSLLWKRQWSKYLEATLSETVIRHAHKALVQLNREHVLLCSRRLNNAICKIKQSFASQWTQITTKTRRHKEKWAIGPTTSYRTVNLSLQHFANYNKHGDAINSGTFYCISDKKQFLWRRKLI